MKKVNTEVYCFCFIGHLKSTVEENDSNSPIQVNDNYIRKIVGQMLRIYDADRTGKVDYALESAGKVLRMVSALIIM